jgi:hypothetical protein
VLLDPSFRGNLVTAAVVTAAVVTTTARLSRLRMTHRSAH